MARGKRGRRSGGSGFMAAGRSAVRGMARDRQRQQRESDRADRRRRDDNWFEEYRSSETHDTGTPQTDLQFGEKGTKGGHIAVDANGDLLFMRDADGQTVYDPKNELNHLPPGWD